MIKKNKKGGFSFVEIVVVIAVLAILAGALAPMLISNVERSRMQKDESAMNEVVNAVQLALTDVNTFDEAYAYCVKNNYLTYSDSSGKYGQKLADEEFWAPDGSGAAVTITFNPDGNGFYEIAKGIVNDMTYDNGSVAEKRTADGQLEQCCLSEMGNKRLYSSVSQTIGDSITETSATYKNSSYTVFILFNVVDGTRKAEVYGQFNGTNLSDGCPAAIGTQTSSYENDQPVIKKTGGIQAALYSNSDLSGSGSIANRNTYFTKKCNFTKQGQNVDWELFENGNPNYFVKNGNQWKANNSGVNNSVAVSTWKATVKEPVSYELRYKVSSEDATFDALTIWVNDVQVINLGGDYHAEKSQIISLHEGENFITAQYKKDSSINMGEDTAYIVLEPTVENEKHICTKHGEEHVAQYQAGIDMDNCSSCEITREHIHKYPTSGQVAVCTSCGQIKPYHSCTIFVVKNGIEVCSECGKELTRNAIQNNVSFVVKYYTRKGSESTSATRTYSSSVKINDIYIAQIVLASGYTNIGYEINGKYYTRNQLRSAIYGEMTKSYPANTSTVQIDIHETYKIKSDVYTVTVINGTFEDGRTSGSFNIDESVKMIANAAPAGLYFDHWERNGVTVSNSQTVFAFISDNCIYKAIYSEIQKGEEYATTAMGHIYMYPDNNQLTFVFIYTVPMSSRAATAGLLATCNAEDSENLYLNTLSTAKSGNYIKSKSLTNTNYTYTWNKGNVTEDQTWYVRPYITYTCPSGHKHTLYGDTYQTTLSGYNNIGGAEMK